FNFTRQRTLLQGKRVLSLPVFQKELTFSVRKIVEGMVANRTTVNGLSKLPRVDTQDVMPEVGRELFL
ncbi:MAG TPA: hypothetical protein PKX93_04965, partial [bacterium]|nr:hypothetical protein [bacterium]